MGMFVVLEKALRAPLGRNYPYRNTIASFSGTEIGPVAPPMSDQLESNLALGFLFLQKKSKSLKELIQILALRSRVNIHVGSVVLRKKRIDRRGELSSDRGVMLEEGCSYLS